MPEEDFLLHGSNQCFVGKFDVIQERFLRLKKRISGISIKGYFYAIQQKFYMI